MEKGKMKELLGSLIIGSSIVIGCWLISKQIHTQRYEQMGDTGRLFDTDTGETFETMIIGNVVDRKGMKTKLEVYK